MALRFAYRRARISRPAIALGGRMERPQPIVPVTVLGPTRSTHEHAGLDTMADDTVFPLSLATAIGLDLSNAPQGLLRGVSGTSHVVYYAQVVLRMTDGKEFREWPAIVGFSPAPLRRPLLGFAGCLQFFTTTFHGDHEVVELAVNRLYSGS